MTFEELMECHSDNRKVYEELLAQFKQNCVVPYFGAGMSGWADYPDWENLLTGLCGEDVTLKGEVEEALAKKDYAGAAELIEKKMGRVKFRWMLAKKFKETEIDERKRPEYQRLFPKLFKRALLTTNFDQAIEALYPEDMEVVNPADEYNEYRLNGTLQRGGRVLLKLHGDIDDPDHIVLTRKDYDDTLGADGSGSKKKMTQYLQQVLSNGVVLFLGSKLKADHDPTGEMIKRFCAGKGLTHFAVMSLTTNEEVREVLGGIKTIWYKAKTKEERNAVHLALFSQLVADLGIGEADDRAFLPVRDLVGREKEVEEVCSYWAAHQEPLAPLVWMSGPGGIGKTELCKAVCAKLAEAGRKAFIPMSALTTLEGFYDKVLTTLGQDPKALRPGELAGAATRALEKCCAGGVAYFDNAEDLCDKLDSGGKTEWVKWLNGLRTAKVGVVVSSRMATLFAGRTNCEDVDVKRLADDAAKTLFTAVWGRGPEDYELADYNWLIGQLEGYPLAIVLVALQARARGYLDRAGWEKAAEEISPDDQQSHVSVEIALRTSWEAIRQELQAVELWGVFHSGVVPLGITVLEGLFDGRVPAVGLGKLQSLGLVYRVEGSTVAQFDMLNPIKKQFPALAGKGAVDAARERWLAYLRVLLPRADQTDVPQEERVTYEQECAAKRTVYGLLPQMWRLLEDLCTAKEENAATELMSLASNFFSYDVNSAATLETLRGFFRDKSERKVGYAFATRCLGEVWWLRDEYDMAEKAYKESLAICREIGSRQNEADVHRGMGHLREAWGKYPEAEEEYGKALKIYWDIGGNRRGEADALRGLGSLRRRSNDDNGAKEAYDKSVAIFRAIGDRRGEADALRGVGHVWRMRGKYAKAEMEYNVSLEICKEIGYRRGVASTLLGLGGALWMWGKYSGAKEKFDEALKIYREIGDQMGEANALVGLGLMHEAQKNTAMASEEFKAALEISERIGYALARKRARGGIERLK